MFNFEEKIAEWRRQMLVAGIKTPAPLDELESHLREDVEQQIKLGLTGQQAFASAVHKIGPATVLKSEFIKVGGTIQERLKHFILTLTGIPSPQLATNMNTSYPNSNVEPAWATYLKSAAFLLPAVGLWILSMVFVFPRFQELCSDAGVVFPKLMRTAIALAHILQRYFVFICVGFTLLLALLEWRESKWPRYRRASFGIIAFLLNSAVLVWIFAMVVLSLVAAGNLAHHDH